MISGNHKLRTQLEVLTQSRCLQLVHLPLMSRTSFFWLTTTEAYLVYVTGCWWHRYRLSCWKTLSKALVNVIAGPADVVISWSRPVMKSFVDGISWAWRHKLLVYAIVVIIQGFAIPMDPISCRTRDLVGAWEPFVNRGSLLHRRFV